MIKDGKRVWSNTVGAWAWELLGTVYKERVETPGQVPMGYDRYADHVDRNLPDVIDVVLNDSTTRQAMLTWPMYEPNVLNCFFAAQILYREPDVHLMVYMRSSDRVKFLSDVLFFRWIAQQADKRLADGGLDTRYVFLTCFKGSDHEYETRAL